MRKVLSNYKSCFAQDNRRKAGIIVAYRIPQVSRQSTRRSGLFPVLRLIFIAKTRDQNIPFQSASGNNPLLIQSTISAMFLFNILRCSLSQQLHHTSSYLSEPGMNFAMHGFALPSKESNSQKFRFLCCIITLIFFTSTLNAALNLKYSSRFRQKFCTFCLTILKALAAFPSNN